MVKRTVLTADEGYILTDGNIYGKVIYLAEDRSEDEFSEISEAEYAEKVKQDEAGALGGMSTNDERAFSRNA